MPGPLDFATLPPVSGAGGPAAPSLPAGLSPTAPLPPPTIEDLSAKVDDLENRVAALEQQPPSAVNPLTPPGL